MLNTETLVMILGFVTAQVAQLVGLLRLYLTLSAETKRREDAAEERALVAWQTLVALVAALPSEAVQARAVVESSMRVRDKVDLARSGSGLPAPDLDPD